MVKEKTIRYFAYVRKSTEGEERQALSISSQIDKARELFGNLNVVEVLEEKHSAFKPYNRPVFEDMIKRIQKGEAGGIIAWHPDRLSRNEIDASTVTYLVRTGVIEDLKFGSYNFDNSPEGIMMLQLALSQSQYFSSKLGKDVKRGLEKRFELGWHPNSCPNGYINVKDKETGLSVIDVDEERYKPLKKAFKLMITGNYSVPEILDKLNNDWGFKPKKKKDNKSGKLSRSSLYRIFTNPFYAGIIEYNGKQKQGRHKPIITLEEFDRIQFLLGAKGRPRKRVNNFAYSGLIRCSYCGSLVTADRKTKIIKKTGKEKTFVYYRCNHKKPNVNCQEKPISLPELEKQIVRKLKKYEFEPDFKELLFKILDDCQKENPSDNVVIVKNLEKRIEEVKLERSNLTKLSCKGLIPDDEFKEERNSYEKQLSNLKQKLIKTKKEKGNGNEFIKDVKFAVRAVEKFEKGKEKDRKEIVTRLRSNCELGDRKLLFKAKNWVVRTENVLKPLEAKFITLELGKKPITKAKSKALTLLCCEVRGRRDSNPRPPA